MGGGKELSFFRQAVYESRKEEEEQEEEEFGGTRLCGSTSTAPEAS